MATCSPCGQYFAWLCNEGYHRYFLVFVKILKNEHEKRVVLVSVKTRELVQHVDLKNVLEYGISPLGRYVTTFERMSTSLFYAP